MKSTSKEFSSHFMSYFNGMSRLKPMDDDDYSYDSESDDDDDSFDNSSILTDESIDESDLVEKVYICDFNKIYISLYEAIEKYRTLKQTKKKNVLTNWNDLPVFLPNGLKTDIKTAPDMFYKHDQKSRPKEKVKIENSVQTKSIVNNNNNNNHNNSQSSNEQKTQEMKKELPKQNKVEKISKKKLKKQRQKEKKETQKQKQTEKIKEAETKKLDNENKNNNKIVENIPETKVVCQNENDQLSVNNKSISNSNVNIKAVKELIVQEIEENVEVNDDLNLLDENTAFVSNALKKSEKKDSAKAKQKVEKKEEKSKKVVAKSTPVKENVNTKNVAPKPKPILNLPSTSGLASNIDLLIKKKPAPTANQYKDSVLHGKRAIELLMKNELSKALETFTEAIRLNSHDLRHFINRSFCYLRLGEYKLALEDAKIVIRSTNDPEQLVKAKFRAGLAFSGLQNFQNAEKYLDEAFNFGPSNFIVHQELLRVKVLQLLSMGFRERDILETLHDCPSVEGAISILAEKTITDEDNDYIYKNENDDDIYNSDDEENPSLTRMFRNLYNYQQGFIKKINPFVNPSALKIVPQPLKVQPKIVPQPLKVQPKIVTTTSIKDVNDKAIWIGNTTPEITETMLREYFSKYGKIVSLFRKPNENYTFINFENAKSVKLLLINSYVQIDKHKLPIKSATRNK